MIIGDGHFLRAGLRAILESQEELNVVAEGNLGETLSMISVVRPELAVLHCPSYAQAIPALTDVRKKTKCPAIVVTTEPIPEIHVCQLLTQGASGIILLEGAPQHLPWAVIATSRGSRALSPEISDMVISKYTAPAIEVAQKEAAREKICTLTSRERDVLALLSEGMSNKSIAQTLIISSGTVKDHVRSLCAKLGVESRFHAARIAWQANQFCGST
ncbi:LuxR C-terminal-related transcriptional regulator [Streptomyces sp. NPDC015414]|uniref:LuxR C-terminal-related transcriptional regulator n=1 Tax=Streptomyces sp. NPDC015414 TaxID=3364957 RepID=UPI0036F6A6C7